jgi:hypothetical protein
MAMVMVDFPVLLERERERETPLLICGFEIGNDRWKSSGKYRQAIHYRFGQFYFIHEFQVVMFENQFRYNIE